MKKKYIIIISLISIILIVVGYLYFPREIKIYEEFKVHSIKKTGGYIWLIIFSDEGIELQKEKYDIEFPKVDFNKYFLLWTKGRRIKKLSYNLMSKYKWRHKVPKGVATFTKEYYPHTSYFYKIEKVRLLQDWNRHDELEKELEEIKKKQADQS